MQQTNVKRILGLDLGEGSVGWALLTLGEDGWPLHLEAGARIFSPVLKPKDKTPLNQERRAKRSARRLRQRRRRRLTKLQNRLVRAGLLPSDLDERLLVLGSLGASANPRWLDPYALRAKALDGPLEPYELGRVFYHLGQRRGFLSNKKTRLVELIDTKPDPSILAEEDTEGDLVEETASKEEKKEASETLQAIHELREEIETSGCRTLGEYLYRLKQAGEKVRCRRTSRSMYIEEFDAIWNAQWQHHPKLLTDELYTDLYEAIFYQRPLRAPRPKKPRAQWPRDEEERRLYCRLRKNCQVFPDRPVARKGHWVAHRFRILQDVRNLELLDCTTGEVRRLSDEEVKKIATAAQSLEKMTWARARKEIGYGGSKGKFVNFEGRDGAKKELQGNSTERFLKQVLADKWDTSLELDPEVERHQLELMHDIETAPNKRALIEILQRPRQSNPIYPLTREQALAIAGRSFGDRTVGLSVRAMRKLHKLMLSGGRDFYQAKRDLLADAQDSGTRIVLEKLDVPPDVPNPRIQRALFEVRKVVNAIIEEFGKPDAIIIELARDMRESRKQREERLSANRRNEAENNAARQFYKQHGIDEPTREAIRRYRLWKEQNQMCPYTGRPISVEELLSEKTEVDHLLPLPLSADDSFANLVLTHRETNADKSNRLLCDWLSPEQYEAALRRIEASGNRARAKRARMREIPEGFAEGQIVTTAYLARLATEYLKTLGVPVQVTNGRATAILRRWMGLNNLLPPRETKKKKGSQTADGRKEQDGGKSRLDHRHHAVDAVVVALTDRSRYIRALEEFRGVRTLNAKEKAPETLRVMVKKALEQMTTSHDVDKGIRGALHEEKYLGKIQYKGKEYFVKRVEVRDLIKQKWDDTSKNLEKIVDDDLRKRIAEHLRPFGNSAAEALRDDGTLTVRDGAGKPMRIKTVRLRERRVGKLHDFGDGRYAVYGNNHHIEIVKKKDGKLDARAVTMLEAARSVRPPKRRSPYGLTVGEGEELVMALVENEMVRLADGNVYRVAGVSSTDKFEITLRDPNDARTGGDPGRIRIRSPKALAEIVGKVTVDVLGRIRDGSSDR